MKIYSTRDVLFFYIRKRLKHVPETSKKETMETTKRGKLAKLAGFELEAKKYSFVPKDTKIFLMVKCCNIKAVSSSFIKL
jgi:hypothetical protein